MTKQRVSRRRQQRQAGRGRGLFLTKHPVRRRQQREAGGGRGVLLAKQRLCPAAASGEGATAAAPVSRDPARPDPEGCGAVRGQQKRPRGGPVVWGELLLFSASAKIDSIGKSGGTNQHSGNPCGSHRNLLEIYTLPASVPSPIAIAHKLFWYNPMRSEPALIFSSQSAILFMPSPSVPV